MATSWDRQQGSKPHEIYKSNIRFKKYEKLDYQQMLKAKQFSRQSVKNKQLLMNEKSGHMFSLQSYAAWQSISSIESP